ncbi:hypothetical protein [Pseudonocardia sp. GCM10023141]|uniref:hypothetical protein n=1 Tax=Pseudonocardia sp. GCM10023141 TaxID=3252653 RepID=UPI00360E11A3
MLKKLANRTRALIVATGLMAGLAVGIVAAPGASASTTCATLNAVTNSWNDRFNYAYDNYGIGDSRTMDAFNHWNMASIRGYAAGCLPA